MGLQPNLAGKENMFLNKNSGLDVAFVAWVIRAAKGIRIGPALCQGTKYSELLLML